MAMKEKKPGDHIILRLKNNESPLILDWINSQSNLSDAIRFLLEEEIKAHAVRDLQEYIPAKRKPLEAEVEQAADEEPEVVEAVERPADPSPEPEPKTETHSEEATEPEIEKVEDEPRNEEDQDSPTDPDPEPDSEPEQEPESAREPEPSQEAEAKEEESEDEDEYSDEIIDHWMNI